MRDVALEATKHSTAGTACSLMQIVEEHARQVPDYQHLALHRRASSDCDRTWWRWWRNKRCCRRSQYPSTLLTRQKSPEKGRDTGALGRRKHQKMNPSGGRHRLVTYSEVRLTREPCCMQEQGPLVGSRDDLPRSRRFLTSVASSPVDQPEECEIRLRRQALYLLQVDQAFVDSM